MAVTGKLLIIAALIVLSMAGGYAARRYGLVREGAARWLMTLVAVFGYPFTGFLSVWATPLGVQEFWLTTQQVLHMGVMTVIGLGVGRLLTKDRGEAGLFAIASAVGNNGFTMGGFVLYVLRGDAGLGLANVYFLLFSVVVVVMHYPLARAYSTDRPAGPLGGLVLRSVFDWRSLGLPMTVAGIALSMSGVPRPACVERYRLLDALIFGLTPVAYFAIGLRLHAEYARRMWRMVLALAGMRFVVGAVAGAGLFALTWLTPWPLQRGSLNMDVCLVEAFVPMAVTVVAVANMFGLKPREASLLFVANTVMYLVLVLPVVMWVFG
jgi:predicted permease